MARNASDAFVRDLSYAFKTRRRKKFHAIHLHLNAEMKEIKQQFKEIPKKLPRDKTTETQLLRQALIVVEHRIDQAQQVLFQELKETVMAQLSSGMQGYLDHAFNVYFFQTNYTVKPPRTWGWGWFKRRLIKPYRYVPQDLTSAQTFFTRFNQIVETYRHRIYFKNGRIKQTAFRQYYSKLYYHFVEAGNLHDFHLKKPLTQTFQTNGGIYGWEFAGKMVYIGRTQNFNTRMRQHEQCFIKLCRPKKYRLAPYTQIQVHLLAITNNQDAQKVLETVYYQRYQPALNAVKTLSLEKIIAQPQFKAIWEETIHSDHVLFEAENADEQTLITQEKDHFEEAFKGYLKAIDNLARTV